MIKVNNSVMPSIENWQIVINGMRNAFKSWNKNDSTVCDTSVPKDDEFKRLYCSQCPHSSTEVRDGELMFCCNEYKSKENFVLGKNDKNLLLNLCKLGASDRKVLRQLPVTLDITAPLYWWKQFDQYKIGTVTNSTSTMHTLMKYPFKIEDFSVDYYRTIFGSTTEEQLDAFEMLIVSDLNDLRDKYIETKDMAYWYALNELLPQSYNQTRTWSGNYEILVNYYFQRRTHKLDEHKALCQWLLVFVPYFKEIVEAIEKSKDE